MTVCVASAIGSGGAFGAQTVGSITGTARQTEVVSVLTYYLFIFAQIWKMPVYKD